MEVLCRPEAILFDCDGVLLDSEILTVGIFAELCTRHGLPATAAEVHALVGLKQTDILDHFAERADKTVPPGMNDVLERELCDRVGAEVKATRGILDLLPRLRLPRAVASSSTPERLRITLARGGILPFVEGRIFSASMVAQGKPAPDLFLLAASHLGAAPENCLVIEDSPYGIEAAIRGGMTPLGYAGGLHMDKGARRRLTDAGAVHVMESWADFPALVPGALADSAA